MRCFILEDLYAKVIYDYLKIRFPKIIYPIQDNIFYPTEYISQIDTGDIILLDNFFRSSIGREEPLGATFLYKLSKTETKPIIICISDYGKSLINKYEEWADAFNRNMIITFIPSKDPQEIADYIERILKLKSGNTIKNK